MNGPLQYGRLKVSILFYYTLSIIEFANSVVRMTEVRKDTIAPLSPSLLKIVGQKRKDLQQCLAEDKKGLLMRPAMANAVSIGRNAVRASPPLRMPSQALSKSGNSSTVNIVCRLLQALFPSSEQGNELPSFRSFNYPHVIIFDTMRMLAPTWKEYNPQQTNSTVCKYPQLFLTTQCNTCPFIPPQITSMMPSNKNASVKKHSINAFTRPTTTGILTRSKAAAVAPMPNVVTHNNILRASMTVAAGQTETQNLSQFGNTQLGNKENVLPQPHFGAKLGTSVSAPNPPNIVLLEDDAPKRKEPVKNLVTEEADEEEEDEEDDLQLIQNTPIVNPLLVNANKKPSPKETAVYRARPGYCECCGEKYAELEKHIRSIGHRQYALQDSNYSAIDSLLAFMERPKLNAVNDKNNSQQQPGFFAMPMSPVSSNNNCNAAAINEKRAVQDDRHQNVPPRTNYTLKKRASQNEAIKHLNLHTSIDPGDNSDDEVGNEEASVVPLNSSPSFKLRRVK